MNSDTRITVCNTIDDIKADVKELVGIVIADKISVKRFNEYRSLVEKRYRSMLQRRLEHELQIAYITDIYIISKDLSINCFLFFQSTMKVNIGD